MGSIFDRPSIFSSDTALETYLWLTRINESVVHHNRVLHVAFFDRPAFIERHIVIGPLADYDQMVVFLTSKGFRLIRNATPNSTSRAHRGNAVVPTMTEVWEKE